MNGVPWGKLDNAILDGSAGLGWSVLVGYAPHIQSFTIDAGEADRLLPSGGSGTGGPYTLVLKDGEGKEKLRAEKLYVIGSAETLDPYRKTILVADRRIWWQRKRVKGSFNVRRRSGEKRRLSESGVPEQIAQIADDVAYHPATLRDGKPWTPREVAERVLNVIDKGEFDAEWGTFPTAPLEDLDIDDEGPTALARALAFLPGAIPYVGLDGRVKILDTTQAGKVSSLVARLQRENPIFANGRYPLLSDRRALRPTSVRVLFPVEQEVRFDSLTPSETITKDQRYMQNVAPIPDPTLTVNGKVKVSGSFETFDALFPAWNAEKGGADVPDITDEALRMFWCSGFPEAYWAKLGELTPTAVWIERIACCRAHYRQTFRINRRWVDRVYQFRPYRVSILDEENGLFGRAQAFTGYCIVASTKGLLADPSKQFYMLNVDGSVNPGQSLAEGRVAPCIVNILDPELGIIRLDYQTDLLGHYRQIIPSMVDNVPTHTPSKASNSQPLTMDGSVYGEAGVGVTLKESNRVSIILTVVPAAPNGKALFKAIEVSAGEAVSLLPSGAQAFAANSTGPVWELRVGGQLATARYAWSDSKAGEIEAAMGVGLPVTQADENQRVGLEELLCNPKELTALAKSMAASVYAGLLDGWVGDYSCDMDSALLPVGTVRQVSHLLSPDGVLQSTLHMREDSVPYDPMATLPDSARRLFLRTVQP